MSSVRIFSLTLLFLIPATLMFSQETSSAKHVVAFAVHRPWMMAGASVTQKESPRKVTVRLMNALREARGAGGEAKDIDLSAVRPKTRESIFKEQTLFTITD